jgi:hypothetical protein
MDAELQLTPKETAAFATHYDQPPPLVEKPEKPADYPCWPWNRHDPHKHKKNERGGYGMFKGKGAHRVMWVLIHGPLPDDPKKKDYKRGKKLEVCHHCDVRNCVQPAHLFTSDHKGNHLDAGRKKRKYLPTDTKPRYTDEEVLLMRLEVLAGASRESRKHKYGGSTSAIFKAIAGTGPTGTYKHVPCALGWTDGPYQKPIGGFLDFKWDADIEGAPCPE